MLAEQLAEESVAPEPVISILVDLKPLVYDSHNDSVDEVHQHYNELLKNHTELLKEMQTVKQKIKTAEKTTSVL